MGLEDRQWYWEARAERDQRLAGKAQRASARTRSSDPGFGSDLGSGPEIDFSRYEGLFRLLLVLLVFFAAIVSIAFVFVTVLRML
ncbi:hypothetical protein THIOKS13280003 [Thiocapsa sp. KS1]|nr:hypothetical protein THIOKS13280003 [Thiocapsa sp. KS1]